MNGTQAGHGSPQSAHGILYQLWVGLERCHELEEGEALLIEVDGDLSVPTKAQEELKHYDASDPLTSGDINIWNTLRNWMADSFDEELYRTLILRTTQPHGRNSKFKDWNDASVDARLQVLRAVWADAEARAKGKSEVSDVLKLMRLVMSPAKADRLRRVAGKFWIAACEPDMEATYAKLLKKRCPHIPSMNEKAYLDQLAGFLIRPTIVQAGRWTITQAEFKKALEDATRAHVIGNQRFPVKYRSSQSAPLTPEQAALHGHLFVSKIKEIDYGEQIPSAIKDYSYAQRTVLDDFQSYSPESDAYSLFAEDVERAFESSRTVAKRLPQRCSKSFYDQVTSAPPPDFQGYLHSRADFRNGVIHIHMNESTKPHSWNLDA